MKKSLIILAAALTGCSNHPHGVSGGDLAKGAAVGIFTPDPNKLTREDREIMAREQAEQAAKKVGAP